MTHGVLAAVIEGTTDDVFVKDVEGRFIALNATAARTIGRPREELLGRLLHDVLPRDVADMMAETDRLILERGTVETFEELVSVDGEPRVHLTTKGPYRARDGTLLGTFGIARNITARKRQEEELGRNEERFRLAQEGARMGTWDLDVATGVTTWSDGLRTLYGVGPDFPTGFEGFEPLLHPDDRDRVNREVSDAEDRAADFEFECRIVRPDAQVRWLMARSSVRVLDGAVVRQLGVVVDITERKRTEEELARSEETLRLAQSAASLVEVERSQLEIRLRQAEKLEALGQLAGGVAHDFNNLLVAIRGYGELALGRLGRGEDGVTEDIEGVLRAADRAVGLTKQLLAFGRRQVLNPEVLDLNDVVRETGGLLQQLIGDNVTVLTTLAEAPVVVRADRGQLEQVITNLAVNARDAMPGGGLVTIHVGTAEFEGAGGDEPRRAVLSVSDEGSGIDATTAAFIFDPFFTTKGDEGTGLGLATVYGIVAQSGGHLVLDTAPGAGSTFSVFLPLSAEVLPVADIAPAPARVEGTERILLIDDDPTVLTIVSSMLASRGYEIIGAANGAEAIARFETRERPIQLVISDLSMRGLDGRETTDRIRGIDPTTKVLYMSGYTDDATIRSGALSVGTSFIQKPFSGDALASCVRELLDHVAA